jgi:hypothetical protein
MQSKRAERLKEIAALAEVSSVEIFVHPQKQNECDYLMSDEFSEIISRVETNNYASLQMPSSHALGVDFKSLWI